MMFSSVRSLAAMGLAFFLVCNAQAQVGSGAVTYNGGATQDFDALANTGESSVLPSGWYFREAGGTTTGTYLADNGAANQGNVFSLGATGSTDRALGSLGGNNLGGGGTVVAEIGARLTNQSGSTLTSLAVAFTGELWRLQVVNVDRLAFEFSTDATSLTTGTWTAAPALDFATPPGATGIGPKDGNLTENRTAVSATLGGFSVAQGSDLWIRWRDTNISGNDNTLGIDDVVFGTPVDNPPSVVSSTPIGGSTDVAVATIIELAFSESIAIGNAAGTTLACGAGNLGIDVDVEGATLNIAPQSALPFGATCVLDLTADAITDIDGTADPMAAPFALTFSTEVDDAPILMASTPIDGATDFPANASLQLTFSEAVTTGASWFQIVCATSGTRNVGDTVVTGGPIAFGINPNADFTQGESCALELNAAQILDQDGVANAFVGDASIAFTPAAPVVNQLPTVLSTTPMQGADDFPPFADLVVLFSEPVTLSPGAFALSCTASTGIVLTHSSGGTSFTIDTGTALVASDSCTFTINRTLVQDAEGASPAANTTVNFSVASSSVGGYYSQVNPSSPDQLRCSLHETIKGHTLFPYGWDQLEMADEDPNDTGEILDIYRNCSFTKVASRVGNGGAATTCGSVSGLRYNREHVWPRSLGFNNGSNNLAAHNDLHMLHLSDETFNANRGNKPFATCTQASGCSENRTITNNGDTGGDGTYPGNSNWYTASTDGNLGSYEVWHRWRGNMARAIFYMSMRYEGIAAETTHDGDIPDLELTDNRSLIVGTSNTAANAYMGLLSTLLAWHAQDPVDARELERNEIVFGYQGNRNPFVDHPEWATLALFQSTQPPTCVLGGGGNSAPVAVDDGIYAATEDTLLGVSQLDGVLDNDTDADADALTALLVAQATNGVVNLSANGAFTYTPTANTCGNDQFTYRASDSQAQSNVAIARIAVACVNDAPTSVGTLPDRTAQENVAIAPFSVAGGFADVDAGDDLDFAQTGLPTGLTLDAETGSISGTPASGSAVGSPHNVVITATDSGGLSTQQTFSYSVTPDGTADPQIFADGFEG